MGFPKKLGRTYLVGCKSNPNELLPTVERFGWEARLLLREAPGERLAYAALEIKRMLHQMSCQSLWS